MNSSSSLPLVSIISINYNELGATIDLLHSLKKVTYPNIETIIIDNASKVDPKNRILEVSPEVHVINSAENLGFAGGNNLGVKEAKGKYLFFVNNDAELEPNCIQPLVETLEQDDTIGAISPKFHYFHQPGIIEYAGYTEMNSFTGRNTTIGANQKDIGQFDTPCITKYVHGGGMILPMQVIQEVGMMPEEYFLYYEEFDWCVQIKKAGYKIFYQPKSLVKHKVSASIGQSSPLKTYYLTRNRIYFMWKNKDVLSNISFLLFLIFFTIPKNLVVYLVKGEIKNLAAFVRAIAWNLGFKKSAIFKQ